MRVFNNLEPTSCLLSSILHLSIAASLPSEREKRLQYSFKPTFYIALCSCLYSWIYRATTLHILTTKPEFLLTESRFRFVSQKIFVKPPAGLPGLLSLSPVSLDFPASQAGGNLESRTNHSLPIFVSSSVQIVLSLVKMFGNVSPHCLGFVTLPRS